MKHYSTLEIEKRTSRLAEAQRVRIEKSAKMDSILLDLLREYPNGLTVTQLVKLGVFKYTYLRNALRRQWTKGTLERKTEIVNQKIRYRWRVKNATS